jgi:hypothetical protein
MCGVYGEKTAYVLGQFGSEEKGVHDENPAETNFVLNLGQNK